jgi:hypothetical protein
LISLTTPRHRILRKASKQRGVADDDSFSFNADFQVCVCGLWFGGWCLWLCWVILCGGG